MEKQKRRLSPLAKVESEALEAGREWTRRRIEKTLQDQALEQGAISPPQRLASASSSRDEDCVDDERGRGGD